MVIARTIRSFVAGLLVAGVCSAVLVSSLAAQISGRVIDETSAGVPAAAVRVLALDSLGVTVLTDSVGRFLIPAAPLGEIRLEVRAFGFGGASQSVEYRGEMTYIDLRVARDPIALDGLAIEVERSSPYLQRSGFYRRSQAGFGSFLDLEAEPPRPVFRTGELLRRMPGIVVRSGEPFVSRHQGRRPCPPVVVVDGIVVRSGTGRVFTFENAAPPPNMIAAIEVYESRVVTPAQWRSTGSGCGVIVIWTKR